MTSIEIKVCILYIEDNKFNSIQPVTKEEIKSIFAQKLRKIMVFSANLGQFCLNFLIRDFHLSLKNFLMVS